MLKKLAKNKPIDVAIILNGGLISCKNITWDTESQQFGIFHGIDGSMEYITKEKLMDLNWSNIGLAIKKKTLILQ